VYIKEYGLDGVEMFKTGKLNMVDLAGENDNQSLLNVEYFPRFKYFPSWDRLKESTLAGH
jgi:hypothetical protein